MVRIAQIEAGNPFLFEFVGAETDSRHAAGGLALDRNAGSDLRAATAPFWSCHFAAFDAVDLTDTQLLALGHVGAFFSHRAFHNEYQERDRERQHGDHPKDVEIGKRRCLLLAHVFEFL